MPYPDSIYSKSEYLIIEFIGISRFVVFPIISSNSLGGMPFPGLSAIKSPKDTIEPFYGSYNGIQTQYYRGWSQITAFWLSFINKTPPDAKESRLKTHWYYLLQKEQTKLKDIGIEENNPLLKLVLPIDLL